MKRLAVACLAVLVVGSAVTLSWSGADPTQRVPNQGPWDAIGAVHPRLSPDGEHAAYSYQGAIWRVATRGGLMKRLTFGPGLDVEPAWSPDGARIALLNGRSFVGGELKLVDARDGAEVELPAAVRKAGVQAQGKLHFSSDGRRLLGSFSTADPPRPEGLAWLDLTTGELAPVLDPPRPARRAALSPSAKHIAFAMHQDVPGQQTGNDGPRAELWAVSADGGEPIRVVRWPARIHDVCWCNEGPHRNSFIVTTDLGGATYDLWQISVPGQRVNKPSNDDVRSARKLTHGQADEDRPSFAVGSVLYTDNREGATALVLQPLEAREERRVGVRATGLDFGRVSGSLRIKFVDATTKEPLVARVTIQDRQVIATGKDTPGDGGKFYAPIGAMYRIERSNGHFYCQGEEKLELPAGDYLLRAWHGPEYRTARMDFRVTAGQTTQLAIPLERWVDSAGLNLYSGENHIHANYGYGEWYNTPESMRLQCEGEDLTVCNFMVANSDGDGVFDRPFFRGQPDPQSGPRTVLYWNQEFRSTSWGHMTLVNLRQLVEPIFTGFKDTTNPWDVPTNSDIADRTHLQRRRWAESDTNGLVNYTHVAQNPADPYAGAYTGKGMPVDVALGKIDTVDINNSYSGSVPLWYRLLNCGFRLPASAGTDCFLNRIRSRLPGSDRAYVRIDGEFSYTAWIEGLRSGRSFVTNGPFLDLTVEGRHRPGDVVPLAAPREMTVVAKAWSQFPLDRVELVLNGRVLEPGKRVEDIGADSKSKAGAYESKIRIEHSGWLAVRTAGPLHADNPGGDAYAHTSPVYFEVVDRPAPAREDAEFFLAWIDRLAAALRDRDRVPSPELKAHMDRQIAAARAVYEKLAHAAPGG